MKRETCYGVIKQTVLLKQTYKNGKCHHDQQRQQQQQQQCEAI